MAQNFQSSFIPKNPVTTESVFQKEKPTGLKAVFKFVFFLSILSVFALFGFKYYLGIQINELSQKLAQEESSLDLETINKMAEFGNKLDLVRSLAQKHQTVSGALNLLASSTVSSVYFESMKFGDMNSEGIGIILNGRATSYGMVAMQEGVFNSSNLIKKTSFSNLSLSENGTVSFDASLFIDPRVILFKPEVVNTEVNQVVAPISTTTTPNIQQNQNNEVREQSTNLVPDMDTEEST